LALVGLEGTLKDMAGRKRHPAEDIVRKLRRAEAVKIASMVDEHTRESLLHLVERSITAQRWAT
jgi:hypothetical protein